MIDLQEYLDCPEKLETVGGFPVIDIRHYPEAREDACWLIVFHHTREDEYATTWSFRDSSAVKLKEPEKPKTVTFYRVQYVRRYPEDNQKMIGRSDWSSNKHLLLSNLVAMGVTILKDTWEEKEFEIPEG